MEFQLGVDSICLGEGYLKLDSSFFNSKLKSSQDEYWMWKLNVKGGFSVRKDVGLISSLFVKNDSKSDRVVQDLANGWKSWTPSKVVIFS